MDISNMIEKYLDEGKIRELYLYQIPVLKTCSNWGGVKEIGKVNFKGKHANYNGALLRYGNSVYFVPNSRIDALSAYRKWNLKKKIAVVTEDEINKAKKKR